MHHLLEPLTVGPVTLANRLVMPPMATAKASPDGRVSRAMLDYYAEKSAGGYLPLIIIEHSYIKPEGKAHENQLSVVEDATIDGLRELATVIHHNGSKAIIQMNHAGSAAKEEVIGTTPVGPSAVANPRQGGIPRELTLEEISDLVTAFANAARRAKTAGFDGVEIHSAHGYLLNQFFSPLTNRRTDEYGGPVVNRIRIHLQVITAVRAVVGEDFLVLLRLGASDFCNGGTKAADSQLAAREFEKAGIGILDISGGFSGYTVPGLTGQGYFAPLTEAIKKVVSLPVILTGGITQVQAAETLLAEGKADLIGVGRAILNDSNWARQAVESLR
jgi:2,4-dienoyl-CoA reductase-like NADH-dependent reductase (Old Yellow Enzyme family)